MPNYYLTMNNMNISFIATSASLDANTSDFPMQKVAYSEIKQQFVSVCCDE